LFVTPVFESVLLWSLSTSALYEEPTPAAELAAEIKARLGADLGDGTINVVMGHVRDALKLPPA
jgi:hypothetical protein